MNVQTHLALLGRAATDKVTGFVGTVSSVCFDLYGCIQCCLTPVVGEDGKVLPSQWFDVSRLEIGDSERVIQLPDFERGYVATGAKGPAEKPPFPTIGA